MPDGPASCATLSTHAARSSYSSPSARRRAARRRARRVALAAAPPRARGRRAGPRLAARGSIPRPLTGLALTLALGAARLRRPRARRAGLRPARRSRRDRPRRAARRTGATGTRPASRRDVLEAITTSGSRASIAVAGGAPRGRRDGRTRSRWVVPFLLLVVAGNGILTTTIKHLVDRVRPDLNPIAETLGPVVPQRALVVVGGVLRGRGAAARARRGRRARLALAGRPPALAVAVAASRVLLDVHWLSDVVAGLALGWAWFAACAIAFGGRLLRFGATAERAAAPGAGEPSALQVRRAGSQPRPGGPRDSRRATGIAASAVDDDGVHRPEQPLQLARAGRELTQTVPAAPPAGGARARAVRSGSRGGRRRPAGRRRPRPRGVRGARSRGGAESRGRAPGRRPER